MSMTKEEKAQTRLRVEEARKKAAELANDTELDNDSINWFFIVRGPPWKQSTVQVRPHRPQLRKQMLLTATNNCLFKVPSYHSY